MEKTQSLVELNDKLWKQCDALLESYWVCLQINNWTRWARALLVYKKENETDEDFKWCETFLMSDEYDVEIALRSIKMVLEAINKKES